MIPLFPDEDVHGLIVAIKPLPKAFPDYAQFWADVFLKDVSEGQRKHAHAVISCHQTVEQIEKIVKVSERAVFTNCCEQMGNYFGYECEAPRDIKLTEDDKKLGRGWWWWENGTQGRIRKESVRGK